MQKKRTKLTIKKSNGTPVGSFGSLNEGFIPTPEQSQEIVNKFKSIINTRLDKLYDTKGADGELYAYGIAVNQVKKKAEQPEEAPAAEETPTEETPTEEPMDKDQKLKEMIQAALSKPLSEKKKSTAFTSEYDDKFTDKRKNLPDGLQKAILKKQGNLEKGRDVIDEASDKEVILSNEILNFLEERGIIDPSDAQKVHKDLTAFLKEKMIKQGNLEEDLDLGHQDDEPHMLKADLYRIGKYAMELYKMVDQFEGEQEVDFPHWWQSKIIKAKDMLVSAKHYLDFELKEPQVDAMVDVASEEEAIDEMSKKQIKKRGEIFDALKAKGMSDEKAGKISTSQAMKKKIKEAIIAKLKQK
jgi:hypothetical protein